MAIRSTIPYKDVNTLEYGMRTSRRYRGSGTDFADVSVGKKKTHFLTIGYTDAEGRQQAVVLRGAVRTKSGRCSCRSKRARAGCVEFQDEEARKAGKG